MIRTKRRLNLGIITLFVFLITPFLSMSGIKNAMSTSIYQAWQIISICCLLIMFLLKNTQIKVGWAIALFSVYQIVILFSSVFNNGISPGIIVVTIASLLIFILLQTDLYYEIISAVSIIVTLALLINFPIMLQNRGSVNAKFFIGGKNALGIFLIPGIFLLLINSLEKNGKIGKLALFLIAFSLITVFIGSSGTGIVVAFCALLFLLLTVKFKPPKAIYLGIIFTIYALFLLFFNYFSLTDFWLKFNDLLGKDSTLTSRATIWNIARGLIKENWLFGAGRGVELSYVNTWGERRTTYEAHNLILEILMEGGIVALLLFGTLFFKAVKHLDLDDAKHRIVFIALCVILMNGLTESTGNSFLVMILLSIGCRYANEQERQCIEKRWIVDSKN